jgi:hypothetical protein
VSNLINLNANTTYYVRAYVTNRKGAAYGDQKSFKTKIAPVFTIGKSYGGGVIFYIDSTGVHGLIAAKTDQSNEAVWGCSGVLIPGADVNSVGKGKKNTDTIIYTCTQPDIAARICTTFISSNYKDWFLPSKDELHLLYLQKNMIGGFAGEYYWSSTQFDKDFAWGVDFTDGIRKTRGKSESNFVRPIRAF